LPLAELNRALDKLTHVEHTDVSNDAMAVEGIGGDLRVPRTDLGTLILNQRDFQSVFLGVAQDQRLSTETSVEPQSNRNIVMDGIPRSSPSRDTY
jgi:hypothetical protein